MDYADLTCDDVLAFSKIYTPDFEEFDASESLNRFGKTHRVMTGPSFILQVQATCQNIQLPQVNYPGIETSFTTDGFVMSLLKFGFKQLDKDVRRINEPAVTIKTC